MRNEGVLILQDPRKPVRQRHIPALVPIHTPPLNQSPNRHERVLRVRDRLVDVRPRRHIMAGEQRRLGVALRFEQPQVLAHAVDELPEDTHIVRGALQAEAEVGELEGGADARGDGGDRLRHGGKNVEVAGEVIAGAGVTEQVVRIVAHCVPSME